MITATSGFVLVDKTTRAMSGSGLSLIEPPWDGGEAAADLCQGSLEKPHP